MHDYKYYAFISYSSKDVAWGKRLQRKLERYKMPATLCREHGWERVPIKPVFFAPADIQPGPLNEELKNRLRNSRNLIVIGSPNSAQSSWVGREIEYFHELGRDRNIHFFIVDGIPGSGNPATECFNPAIKELGLPEILGANINERVFRWSWLNRQRAYVQLISKLLGVEFDSIWQRHKRRLWTRVISWSVGLTAVLASMLLIWVCGRPFDASVELNEASVHNPDLPQLHDAIVTMHLDTETKTDTIYNYGALAEFKNIPSGYFGKPVRLTFNCPDFLPLDTVVRLSNRISLDISRNPAVYGDIRAELYDFEHGHPVINTMVQIDQWETISDNEGVIKLFVPLQYQKTAYSIIVPEYNVKDSIPMPSNDYLSIGISNY